MFLTASPACPEGDPTLWSEKHRQDDLVNFTTRGNVSLNASGTLDLRGDGQEPDPDESLHGFEGVCAHASARTDLPKGTALDRWALAYLVATRRGRVPSTSVHFTGFHDLCDTRHGHRRMLAQRRTTWLSLDYSMKRRPVASTVRDAPVRLPAVEGDVEGCVARRLLRQQAEDPASFPARAHLEVTVDGGSGHVTAPEAEGSMAEFDTAPFADLDEFRSWRRRSEQARRVRHHADGTPYSRCLRMADEVLAFCRDAGTSSGREAPSRMHTDGEADAWNVLMTCVRGHRMGLWRIPGLDRGKVVDKLAFVNTHNDTGRTFTRQDWCNAGRRGRGASMLDPDTPAVRSMLGRMGATVAAAA